MPPPHDTFFRAVFADPANAAAHFAQFLPVELTAALDFSRARLLSGDLVPPELAEREADLLYAVPLVRRAGRREAREALVLLLLEHQSTEDRDMAWRILQYSVLILARWRAENPKVRLFPLLVPMVLAQCPRPWKAAQHFDELIDVSPGLRQTFAHIMPSCGYILTDLHELDDTSLAFHPIVGLLLTILKHSRDKDLLERLPEFAEAFKAALSQGAAGLNALVAVLHYLLAARDDTSAENLAEFLTDHVREDLEDIAMSAADRLHNQGLQEGLAKGREEGREEGHLRTLRLLRRLLLRQIELRFTPPTAGTSERVEAATEAELSLWLDRILTAPSLDDLFAP